MNNSPLIRTAVKLCLIAAIVIQPMALLAARGTCVQSRSDKACCQAETIGTGCQSCEAKTATEPCGCCHRAQAETMSCCSKQTATGPDSDNNSAVDETAVDKPVADDTVQGTCMCGMRAVPIAPAPSQTPVPQPRDLVVIAYLAHDAAVAGEATRRDRSSSRLPIGKLSTHYSQQFLCIWRI